MSEITEIAKENLPPIEALSVGNSPPPVGGELEGASIRSDEVQEIISAVPNWMIRWGITLIFGLIVMLLVLSWLIKYPDIIVGNATLTTLKPPVKLVVKSAGKLTSILVADGSKVEKNQVIAEMENPVTQNGIGFLKGYVVEIRDYLTTKKKSYL